MLAFSIVLFVSLFQPCLFLIIAFARLMVAKYPMESKFRSTKFIVRIIAVIILCLLGGTACYVFSLKIIGKRISNNLCSPFVDWSEFSSETQTCIFFTTITHAISFPIMIIFTHQLIKEIKESKANVNHKDKLARKMYLKLILIIFLKQVYWQVTNVIYLTAHFTKQFPRQVLFWMVAFVIPSHSLTDSVFFIHVNFLRRMETLK